MLSDSGIYVVAPTVDAFFRFAVSAESVSDAMSIQGPRRHRWLSLAVRCRSCWMHVHASADRILDGLPRCQGADWLAAIRSWGLGPRLIFGVYTWKPLAA